MRSSRTPDSSLMVGRALIDITAALEGVVVLAKLRWRLQSRSEVQWRDCVEIAEVQELDREYLHQWAPSLDIADDLDELLSFIDEVG